jgi:hypothetical protein
MRLLGLIGNLPHALFIKAAIYALVFTIGLSVGNSWSTKAALVREQQASADRQRENHRQLLEWTKNVERKLKAQAEQQHEADAEAFRVYQAGIVAASRAKQTAERALATERARALNLKETSDGLKRVNEILASEMSANPGCVLSSGVRIALNAAIASLNAHPTIGSPEGQAPGVPDGPDSPNSLLTCSDLASSVTDILEHDAMLTGWILSFQAWEVAIGQ